MEDRDIGRYMHIADLLISDTSSIIYEFILLDKPVLSVDSKLSDITWSNVSASGVYLNVIRTLWRIEVSQLESRERREPGKKEVPNPLLGGLGKSGREEGVIRKGS